MGYYFVLLIFAVICLSIFKKPSVAAIAYLTFGVMQPQYIWYWHFEGLSPSKMLAIATIVAWFLAFLNKKIDFTIYKKKQNVVLLAMWILVHLSHIFSPFEIYSSSTSADIVIDTLNTIMIMYFVSIGLLVSEKALKYLSIGLVLLVTYYIYWSNDQYFNGYWSQFNQGRLMGPRGSIYRDENVFSTIFMVGMPFILFSFFYMKNSILKYSVFFIIPLLWHSLFLAGSRGAMLATIISTLISSRLTKSKIFDKILIIGFIVALLTQGGAMINRSNETIEISQDSSINEPLNPRLVSWENGLGHIKNHPLLGVGPQRFQHATRVYFPESTPYVAHNTFLSLAAQSGLLVGLLYLYLFWLAYKNYKFCVKNDVKKYPIIDYVNKASITALAGFFICSMFLNLEIFEAFYYLLVMTLVKQQVFEHKLAEEQCSPLLKRQKP